MFRTGYHWGVRSIISGLLGFVFSFNIVAQTTGVSSLPSSVIGKSIKQQAITELTFGTGQQHILIIGGIHGDEPATSDLARALALTYGQTPPPADLMVSIITEANPDGLATRTRVNGRGVDLNRNFPARSWQAGYKQAHHFPGPQPASEPETQAIVAHLDRLKPALIISIHAALGCINWDGPAIESASRLAELSSFPLCASLGYATPGSLGEYAGRDQKIPIITIELRSATNREQSLTLLPALLSFLNASKQQ